MPTRRTLIHHSALAATATLVLGLMNSRSAEAAPTIPKRLADYQDRPSHGHQCSACCMFVPEKPDHCTMIEGVISSHGWCKYWKAGPADTCS